MPQPASALVFSLDRWAAPYAGPYGAGWLPTPELDRLAARGALWEQAWADSGDLSRIARSWWTGRHASLPQDDAPGLAEVLGAAGIPSRLVTDCPLTAALPLAAEFTELVEVDTPRVEEPAHEWQETQLARCTAAALSALERSRPGELVWIHARGAGGPWDAPLAWREHFRGEDDPAPYAGVQPPARQLPGGVDPDEILPYQQAYAAQGMLLDHCLGVLLEEIAARRPESLLLLTAPRGFPLGEHGALGEEGEELFGELLHVPLLMLHPELQGPLRAGEGVEPADLHATLLAWFGISEHDAPRPRRARNLLQEPESPWDPGRAQVALGWDEQGAPCRWLLRTPAWLYRKSLDPLGEEPRRELYVQPDDRWQANDVATRCGEVLALCDTRLEQELAALAADDPAQLPPLPELLLEGPG